MRRGSVILEFVLMMPVLLLLFGGTLLTFEILVGKMHLQEANRNIAWLAEDRYGDSSFEQSVDKMAKSYFTDRNEREKAIDSAGGDLWGAFGGGAYVVERKAYGPDYYNGVTPWAVMMTGNMVVKMKKVSAAYMGAIAVSSVLQGNGEDDSKALYRATYDISHTPDPGKSGDVSSDGFLPESYALHRYYNSDKGGDVAQYRTESYRSDVWKISLEQWPKKESQELSGADAGTSDTTEYRRILFDFTQ